MFFRVLLSIKITITYKKYPNNFRWKETRNRVHMESHDKSILQLILRSREIRSMGTVRVIKQDAR